MFPGFIVSLLVFVITCGCSSPGLLGISWVQVVSDGIPKSVTNPFIRSVLGKLPTTV